MADYTIEQYKGIKNDEDRKNISLLEGYFYDITNFQYSDSGLIGMEEILYPERVASSGSVAVDGLYEYRFLDSSNVLQVQQISVCGGNIYKESLGTKVLLKAGLTVGKCSFVVFNDKLYIANGKDFIYIYDGNLGLVSQMGAPFAITQTTVGNPNGTYYYAITYLTTGGEEYVGSISNTVTVVNKQVLLNLPLGYDGTLTRRIYRTVNGGTQLKLLTAIANNTALTYTDNIADATLGANIPAVNNELPKPQFIVSAYQKLFATKDPSYPTQVFQTDTNIDVIDTANSIDVANYGTDNTEVIGIGSDFNNVVVGTKRNIVFLDASGTTTTVSFTRANIGMKDGFSICNIPSFGDFPGGLVFVSSENDVRMIVGLNELPVATSLGNIRTQDWAQDIRGTLSGDLSTARNISAIFYKYKYYLAIDSKLYTFDIRTKGWSKINVKTIASEYISVPAVFGIFNGILYNGQNDGWIERQHVKSTYRSEEVKANMISGGFLTSDKYKFVESIKFWFLPSKHSDINITVTTDSNESFYISQNFMLEGGVFNGLFYNKNYYDIDERGLDYRTVNIHRACRWMEFEISNSEGNISFYKYTITGDLLQNKEAVA